MAVGLLQPPELPDSDYAEHGEKERVAPGPDVPHVRGHQEDQGGGHHAAQGGGIRSRSIYGGA